MTDKVIIGDATLYLGDSQEIYPTLDKVDAVVTDPPYGTNTDTAQRIKSAQQFSKIHGDHCAPDIRWLLGIVELPMFIFGANCFPHLLPHRGRWACWDKRCNINADRMLGSPMELAWENRHSGFDKMFRVQHGGVVNADGPNQKRVHPTQKPIRLMEMILLSSPYDKAQIIFDPFMGSGTTGVACAKLGRKFIGIEIDPKYFDIACKRIEDAYRQGDMFIEPPAKVEQEKLLI